jgi:regulator of sigma E protease
MAALQMVFWFVVTLGVLVSFHEFGHFGVARRFGVRVLRFSIGFGKPLWSRVARDGTEYQVAAIPLGGYVKFLDGRDGDVPPEDAARAFDVQAVWKRMLIVAAGPVANLLLCLALLWAVFMLGWPGQPPLLAATHGLAAEAGLRAGDRIVGIGDAATPAWDDALTPLALAEIDREPLAVRVRGTDGAERSHVLRLDRLAANFDQTDPLGAIGLVPGLPAVVGEVVEGAAAAGILAPGDRIVAVDGRPVAGFAAVVDAVAAASKRSPGAALAITYRRGDLERTVSIAPRQDTREGVTAWRLGIAPLRAPPEWQRYGPGQAAVRAIAETRKQAGEMLGFVSRLVTGSASTKNLSGVIGIAQVARAEASQGLSRMLRFMAVLSLTLCIMNLLPIPVLDGGHLLYYLIELVSGRPVGERVLAAGQAAGLLLLVGLICLAFYNDIVRTIS